MRRVTLFVSAILMALFMAVLANMTPVEAQTVTIPSTATWEGENLKLDDWTLRKSSTPVADNGQVPSLEGTACENNENIYYSDPFTPASTGKPMIVVLCLDGTDRTQSIPANIVMFEAEEGYTSNDDFEASYRDTVEVSPEGEDALSSLDDAEPTTSCDSNNTYGLGWIICPATKFLSAAMDQLYLILIDFFKVAPLTNDTDSTLYMMWNLVRNLANILFIIGFLFIIYSQITSFGISNYGIKRLLPRLLIAAILVNLSYWICALAVDLSNILGVYVKTLFDGVVDAVELKGNVEFKEITWQSLAGAALTGTVGAVAIGGAVFSLVASAGGSIWFLLVTLMGVLVSALVAIIVLAARQALITVLIIISPLAFVAYLLPSTEKYFDSWRNIFMTLLLLFPIFSLIFGGSQLAGLVIIASALENTNSLNFFNLIILGMVVQIAPIVVTPLLIRFSGSLLGRIASMVNDPNKGIIDRTRKYAQHRHDMTKNRQLWDRDENGRLRNYNPLAMGGRRLALREENDASKLKAWQGGIHAAYEQDKRSHEVYRQNTINEMVKSSGENEAKTEFAHDIATNTNLRRIDTLQRVAKEEAELAENKNKTAYEAIQTSPGIANAAIRDLANRSHEASIDTLDEQQRQSSIHQEHENVYWRDLANNAERQSYAGAAGIAEHGETRVANIVRQKQNEEREKRVNAAISNLSTVEARLDEERAVILGDAANAGRFVSLTEDADSRSGALRRYIGRAPIEHVQTLIEELDITSSANGDIVAETLRSELAGALQKRKPFYISQTLLNGIEEGTLGTQYYGIPGQKRMIQEALNGGALSVEAMASKVDRDDLKAAALYLSGGGTITDATREQLRHNLELVTTDNRYSGMIDKRKKELGLLWDQINPGVIRPLELRE